MEKRIRSWKYYFSRCAPNVKKVIKVYTNKPEIMKGKDGCLLKKYAPLLKECIPDLISIEISKAY